MVMQSYRSRRFAAGAEVSPDGGTHFRVWAPQRRRVVLMLHTLGTSIQLAPDGHGYFATHVRESGPGTLYSYQLDDDARLYPDPASRFQPEGPHGPSEVVDATYPWTDGSWQGISLYGQVFYELHIGTFTPEGTYQAAERELPALRELGVTCLEVMPLAEFPGRFGWGYDGVDLFAPVHLYGRPEDLRRFIDRAHATGLGVILDVVYNHLGPDGNYLEAFSPHYFTDRYPNEWGRSIDFDGPDSGPVREFFAANAAYWIGEYHFDGLRLDATQSVIDRSPRHILAEISAAARSAAGRRSIALIAENEPQQTRLVRPVEAGGYGIDALWNDDFHHTSAVAATGRSEAYYSDYTGRPQELISAAKWGFLYQGQRYAWQRKRRGTPALDLSPAAFVTFLENHDQVANSACGKRLSQLTAPGVYRALSALFLLMPGTPMLFQGQEFASSKPFLYFADHEPELAGRVREGRAEFLAQFPSICDWMAHAALPDPSAPETFERCKLDFSEREEHAATYSLYRDLLALRRTDGAFRDQGRRQRLDGAVLGSDAFVLRFFNPALNSDYAGGAPGEDRLLLVNLGRDLRLESVAEPLLAPPSEARWRLRWSSEHPRYGGVGAPSIEDEDGIWRLPARSAVVMAPEPGPLSEGET
jgi:maltooligosyltrehalose trehalohydrolase